MDRVTDLDELAWQIAQVGISASNAAQGGNRKWTAQEVTDHYLKVREDLKVAQSL